MSEKIKLDPQLIEGFVEGFLRKRFNLPTPIPEAHREWWEMCCRPDRYVAIAAPRGHAKSTAITHSYVLANIMFRTRDFIVIVSDTETQAVQFLNDIKMEITDNEEMQNLFMVDKFLKWTENDIVISFKDGTKTRVLAKGSEQSLRGLKWHGKRPNLVVCDDMENDELVMNKERREKFMRWIYGALIPALSPDGIMRVVGTILHMDSFLESLMPPYRHKDTVHEPLKTWSRGKKGMWVSARYKAHTDDFGEILWPDRFNEKYLTALRKDYVDRGIPDVYSQEYLNYPLDPLRAYFRLADFVESTPIQDKALKEKAIPYTFFVGMDPAISEKERTDFTAFLVVAMDSDRLLYYVESDKLRLDGREIIDLIFRLHRIYDPEFIAIEKEKITQSIGPFFNEECARQGIYPRVIQMPHGNKDLEFRGRSWQGRMRGGQVRFNKDAPGYVLYEQELTQFPRSAKNDLVAASAVLGMALDKMAEALTPKEVEDEERDNEMRLTVDPYEMGRNATTGY